MKISNVKAWVVRQPEDKQAFVIARVDTDGGVEGWGEVDPGTDPAGTARKIEGVKSRLLGLDATSYESIRPRLDPSIQGGVNMALIDILGKICKAPAYEVLGGPTRSRARAMTTLHGSNEAEWIESLRTARAGGYAAVVVPLSSPEDPIRGRGFYRRMRETLERLRESVKGDVDFVLNCRENVPTAEVAGLAKELESFHLLWLEARHLSLRALAEISAEYGTPIGHDDAKLFGAGDLQRRGTRPEREDLGRLARFSGDADAKWVFSTARQARSWN